MGLKDSKVSFTPYGDAVKRVREDELGRMAECFTQECGKNGLMSAPVFASEVFNHMLPSAIAKLIYRSFGGTGKGLSFKELLCGLVLVSRSSRPEKTKFLFELFSRASDTITCSHMHALALQTDTHIPPQIHYLFSASENVTYEEFCDWLLLHSSCLSLCHWLLNEAPSLPSTTTLSSSIPHSASPFTSPSSSSSLPPSSSSSLPPSSSSSPSSLSSISPSAYFSFHQTLSGVTHLEVKDIVELEKQFNLLKGQSASSQFDLSLFLSLTQQTLSEGLATLMFRACDENDDAKLDLKELSCALSASCRSPRAEQFKFCFKLFDVERRGFLEKKKCVRMVEMVVGVVGAMEEGLDQEKKVKEMMICLEKRLVGDVGSQEKGVRES